MNNKTNTASDDDRSMSSPRLVKFDPRSSRSRGQR